MSIHHHYTQYSHISFLIIILLSVITPKVYSQCFNMESLEVAGTICKLANNEWVYDDDSSGRIVGQYLWNWYNYYYEDYGLTGYNDVYERNNVLCTRQTIVDTQGKDYLQPALKMIPEGRETSIRLGNPYAGGLGRFDPNPSRFSIWHPQGEAMTFVINVTPENAILQFQYAALLDRVYHPLVGSFHGAQPHIDVFVSRLENTTFNHPEGILDEQTLAFSHYGNSSIESKQGWKRFTRSGNVTMYWKDWSTTGFDLSPYIGQTVFFTVENYECLVTTPQTLGFKYCGDHFSYLYFYLDCSPKEIQTECLENRQVRLTAPDGFNYRWYTQGNPSLTLGTSREITVTGDGVTTYCCQLTQKEGMTGSFVLTTKPVCSILVNKKAVVCEEDLPYLFAGKSLTQSGHYEDTVHLTAEVDSITTLDLVVQKVTNMPQEKAYFCTGSSYIWKHGNKTKYLTAANTYRDTLRYPSGCDSVRYTLLLEERDKIETEEVLDVCSSLLNGYSGFLWHDILILRPSDNGKKITTTSVVSGCDSVITLKMNIQEELVVYDTIIKPSNFARFKWKGFDIRWRTNKETTEAYYNTSLYCADTTLAYCVGKAYLRLFIVEVKDSIETLSKCDSEVPFTWRGHNIQNAADNGKTYIQKGKNGLDSIKFTLNLTIHPTYNHNVTKTICAGDSYPFGDRNLTTSGTYTNTFITSHGCDSTVTLNLVVQKAKPARTERVHLCDGDNFTWANHGPRFANLTTAGEYKDTARYTTGCDSVYYALRITTGDSTIAHINETICNGDSINFFGETLKSNCVKRGVIRNAAQCDSVIYLHLTVLPPADRQPRDTNVCAGTTFIWKGISLTTDDFVYDTLRNMNDCDSLIIRYNVHFLTTTDEVRNEQICDGDSILFNGVQRKTEGIYKMTEVTPLGCVKNITLNLKVNLPTTSDTTAIVCKPFTWHDQTYTTSGDYTWQTTNIAGCDSTRTLHLTINHSTTSDTTAVACESFTWHGTTYTKTDDYIWQTTNIAGCDSTRTLHLTINHPTTSDTTATANHSFTWHGTTYTASGDYTWHTTNMAGCDSIRTLHLTLFFPSESHTTVSACDSCVWHGTKYTNSGDYQWKTVNLLGYDSICHLHLTINRSDKLVINKSVCEGMTYLFGDTVLATDGVYTRTFLNRFGCDSIVTLNFSVGSVVTGDEFVTHCDNEPYYFIDTLLTTSGTYTHLFQRTGLCDSLARVHFTIYPSAQFRDTTISFCQGDKIDWHGLTIDSQGHFAYIWKNTYGCDSLIDSLHTIILYPSPYTLDTAICYGEQLAVADTILKQSSITSFTLTNAVGCDSLLTVKLTVQSPDTLKTDSVKIADGSTYNWQGHPAFSHLRDVGLYLDTLYYARTGCDSVYAALWLDTYAAEVKGQFFVDTVCADDDRIAYRFVYEQGRAVMYDLFYSESARAQGFKDVLAAAFPDTVVVEWTDLLPKADAMQPLWYVRPDHYSVTLQLTDAENRLTTYNAAFTVLYPSWVILQRWNDVLTITNSQYNGGYEFSKIQWLHNNQLIKGRGENNAYYYAGDNEHLDYNAPYRALLTRKDDGKTFSTCDYLPTPLYDNTLLKTPMIKLSPRHANSNRQIAIETNTEGNYIIYDTAGKHVLNGNFGSAYHSPDIIFPASCADGIYLIRFHTKEGSEMVKKWVVR